MAQYDRPFEERVPSPWIKPLQYAFLAMMLANAAEALVDQGPAYRAAAVLSVVLTVVAAALAVAVIAQVSA